MAINVAPTDIDGGTLASRRFNSWLQRGVSFSGRERNCCFLNMGSDLGFVDVSAVSGLDFPEDGRATCLVDWDHDGDTDLWISNRNGPQLRFLRNDMPTQHDYVSLRLEGKSCNRDAIGARVEVTLKDETGTKLMRTLRAGDGYLSQSSKWIHFGLGSTAAIDGVGVIWPGGKEEAIVGVTPDARYRIVEGTGRATRMTRRIDEFSLVPTNLEARPPIDQIRVVMSSPIPLPRLPFTSADGKEKHIMPSGRRPILLNLWASWCRPCIEELAQFSQHDRRLTAEVEIVSLSVDQVAGQSGSKQAARDLLARMSLPFTTGFASAELLDKLYLIDQQVLDIHRRLPVPMSILINRRLEIFAIYKGPVDVNVLLADVKNVDLDSRSRRMASLPFAGRWYEPKLQFRLLPLVWEMVKAGHLEDGLEYLAQNKDRLKHDDEFAKLVALCGYELLERGEVKESEQRYREAIRHDPRTIVAYLNLGVALIRQGRYGEALTQYRDALRFGPHDPRISYSIAWLLATTPDERIRNGIEAISWAERAARATDYKHAPTLDALAAAYAESGRFDEALSTIKKAMRLAATDSGQKVLEQMEERRLLYQSKQAYREPLPTK